MAIFQSELYDKLQPPSGGVKEKLWVIPFDDLAGPPTENADGEVTAITLKNNKLAYVFEGSRNNVRPSHTQTVTDAGVFYTHQVIFYVHNKSQLTKNNIEQLANTPHVYIYENLTKDLNAFEILGLERGMYTGEQTQEANSPDNSGAHVITAATGEGGSQEPKKPRTFNAGTSYTNNLSLVEALANLPQVFNTDTIAGSTAGGDSYVISGNNFFNTASTPADDVTSVDFINSSTEVATNQASFTTNSDTQLTIASSVALAAATYRIRITTSTGSAATGDVIVIS